MVSLFVAILFAILQVIGYSITAYQTLSVLGQYWVLTILKTVGLSVMYYSVIYVVFEKLSEYLKAKKQSPTHSSGFFALLSQ